MATHSSVLAWRIPGTGCRVGCHLWGRTESDATEVMQQQQQQRGERMSGRLIPTMKGIWEKQSQIKSRVKWAWSRGRGSVGDWRKEVETRREAEEVRNLCMPNYINIQLMPTIVESPEYHLYFSLYKIYDTWKKTSVFDIVKYNSQIIYFAYTARKRGLLSWNSKLPSVLNAADPSGNL